MISINVLYNEKLLKIGRASNMLWMTFGPLLKCKDVYGKDIEKGKYAIHCQSPWRIVDDSRNIIKVASADIYQPSSCKQWSEDFDWEPQGNNLFDEKIELFFKNETDIRVIDVSVSENYDLKLILSNGLIFECFVDVSTEQECWRFFEQGIKKHLVISGNGKKYQ